MCTEHLLQTGRTSTLMMEPNVCQPILVLQRCLYYISYIFYFSVPHYFFCWENSQFSFFHKATHIRSGPVCVKNLSLSVWIHLNYSSIVSEIIQLHYMTLVIKEGVDLRKHFPFIAARELHLSITLYRNAELIQEPSEAWADRNRPSALNVRVLIILKQTPESSRAYSSIPRTAYCSSKTPLSIFFWKGEIVCDRRIMEIFFKCFVLLPSEVHRLLFCYIFLCGEPVNYPKRHFAFKEIPLFLVRQREKIQTHDPRYQPKDRDFESCRVCLKGKQYVKTGT